MIIIIGKEDKDVVKQKALETISKCIAKPINNINYLPSGQPVIENGYISISHTENVVIVAYSQNEIGVDIENKNRDTKLEDISIRQWTQIEAYYKKIGTGISLSKVNTNIPTIEIKTIEYLDYYISVCCIDEDVFVTFV